VLAPTFSLLTTPNLKRPALQSVLTLLPGAGRNIGIKLAVITAISREIVKSIALRIHATNN